MIRRMFKLPAWDAATDGPVDHELIVTYDPQTGTLNVGHRARNYDEWSRPLEEIDRQDDEAGRVGGPGSVRGDVDLSTDEVLIEQMRRIVERYDARPVVPDVAPPSTTSGE